MIMKIYYFYYQHLKKYVLSQQSFSLLLANNECLYDTHQIAELAACVWAAQVEFEEELGKRDLQLGHQISEIEALKEGLVRMCVFVFVCVCVCVCVCV